MRHRDKATTSGQGTSERSEQRGEEKPGTTPHERRGNMSRDESKSDRNGATTGQGEWGLFQQFLRNPKNIAGIQKKLESAAAAAYKKGK